MASVMITVLTATASLLTPWPLTIIVDYVVGGKTPPPIFTVQPDKESYFRILLLFVAVVAGLFITLSTNVLNVLANYVNTKIEQSIILDFRGDLFQHTQRLSVAYHNQSSTARTIFAVNFEASGAGIVIMALQPLAQSALTLIGMILITFQIDWVLALVALSIVPFLYYSVGYYVKYIQPPMLHVKNLEAESLAIVHEALSMIRVVVPFGREGHEESKFRRQGKRTVASRVDITVRQSAFSLAVDMTIAMGTALVLGLGGYHALQGQLSAGQLLVVLAYVASIYKPLEAISYTIGSLQDQIAGLGMGFRVMDTPPIVKELPQAHTIDHVRGRITFSQVHFAYPGRSETLNDISFDAPPGQVVALVGPTGAGKTTLMSLLPRFYDPSFGQVQIDGLDVREFTLKSLREQISVVLQEPLLFTGSIADNIRYGRLDASMDDIVQAAHSANAHDFIARFPKQYETEVGERGVQLSGGERQRICVARAFVKNAPILILDEPTSSIDSKTEAVILDALDQLMVGRTTFMIAHRLSTIRHSDLILVLDQGQLVEQGTHEELIGHAGLYKQLYEMQIGEVHRRARKLLPAYEERPEEMSIFGDVRSAQPNRPGNGNTRQN
jgi:ATP-binding cassette, subfamily B, bacterial